MSETKKLLTLFHGDKGGVGKSFCAAVYIDKKLAAKENIKIIETDTRNPDISRLFKKTADVSRVDMTDHSGVLDFLDLLNETEASEVIVSLPAGIGRTLTMEADFIKSALDELGYKLRVFWPINRLKDSLTLLAQFHNDNPLAEGAEIIVVLNGFFGEADKFSRWHDSNIKKTVLKSGDIEVFLPPLHDRVVDAVSCPFSQATDLRFSEKAELSRWLGLAQTAMGV